MSKVIGSELEDKPKKNNKNKIVIIVSIITLLIFLAVGYIGVNVYNDLQQEQLLKEEINAFVEKDLTKDEYIVEIKTKGDYAILEETIKTYIKDFSETLKEVESSLEDEEFLNILSAENYKKDGPEFNKTLEKISTIRTDTIENIEKIIKMCDNEYLDSLIKDKDLDDYYIELYNELLYEDDDIQKMKEARDELAGVKDDFVEFLDKCEEIIKFLKDNKGSWVIEKDNIIFMSNDLHKKYTKLISELS